MTSSRVMVVASVSWAAAGVPRAASAIEAISSGRMQRMRPSGERSGSCPDAYQRRLEERESVGGAEEWIHGALGVGHHAEHVPALARDAGNVAGGAVRVGRGGGLAAGIDVAERDTSRLVERVERGLVGRIASLAVRDGDAEELAGLVVGGEERARA